MHASGLLHATAAGSTARAPTGTGVGSICQWAAFHVSAIAPSAWVGVVVKEMPTAAHRLGDGHATSTRTLLSVPGWSRLEVSFQWLPSERAPTVNDPPFDSL